MGDLVAAVLKTAGIGANRDKLDALQAAWAEAVGRTTAEQTRVQGLKAGVLTVLVPTAPLAHELMVYYKADLIRRLRERTRAPITDLRCKVTGGPTA